MQDEIGVISAAWAKRDAILGANSNLSARAVASIRGVRMGAVSTAPAVAPQAILSTDRQIGHLAPEAPHVPSQPRPAVVRRPPALRPVRIHPVKFRKRRLPPVVALPAWNVTDIVEAVCKVAGISPAAMSGYSRHRYNALPRHVAMYLAEQSRPDWSLPMIARAFGNRHHTTILHAVCKVPLRMMDNRSDSARWYRAAIAILSAGESP